MLTRKFLPILFWAKKSTTHSGIATIYARVTIDGKRLEISSQQTISLLEWDSKRQAVSGRSQQAKTINNNLAGLKSRLTEIYDIAGIQNATISMAAFKNSYFGVQEKPKMLVEIIKQHNKEIFSLIGKGYAKATWTKYESTLKHIVGFLKFQFKSDDIDIKCLNHEFITAFEFYLKSEKNIDTNTNGKYLKNLKKIIKQCVANDWLVKDPFLVFKVKAKKTSIEFLSRYELNLLTTKKFDIPRLEVIKDIFLFSCYTGLAFTDIACLQRGNIVIGIDGNKWISAFRQKTNIQSKVPLLRPALEILSKYSEYPACVITNKLLPVPSNQKTNAYLKEIADCCGIVKKLTFHMARHTFATTITLTNGVPIETVSRMLGHTKIQTTQIYAKVLDEKVSEDMNKVKVALDTKYDRVVAQ